MKTIYTFLSFIVIFFIFDAKLSAQKNVIVKGDAFIHGADALPINDSDADSIFFFDRENLNLFSGILEANDQSIPQVESFGFGGTAFGLDVYPLGSFSFAQGAGNYSESLFSSTLGLGNVNYGYGATSLGILSEPLLSSPASSPSSAMPLLNIGNGDPVMGLKHNAFTVYYDGKVEINQEYILPNVDGSVAQVLSTDGKGNVTWENDESIFESFGGLVRTKGSDADDFVFGSTILPPATNTSDTLFFFDKSVGAFRIGRVLDSDFWTADSLGAFSFATGNNTLASGAYSTAFGYQNKSIGTASMSWGDRSTANGNSSTSWGFASQANGNLSTAWGGGSSAEGFSSTAWGSGNAGGSTSTAWGLSTASGPTSTAWGVFSYAIGDKSTAWGRSSQANGELATAWGRGTEAIGEHSTAWGQSSDAIGNMSTAFGQGTSAEGDKSTAWGIYTDANTYAGVAFGQYNNGLIGNDSVWISTDPLLEVGIGTSNFNRENALTILKNGEISFKEYTFPLNGGNSDQFLKTDGSGNLSWADELDGDPTNELQTISKSGSTVTLSDGGGSFEDLGVFENNSGVVRNTGNNTNDFVFGMSQLPENGKGYTKNLFFFDENLGAFRAGGLINSTNWQTSSLGQFSIAMGQEPTASGDNSMALGLNASATEASSIAMGTNSSVTGVHGVAIGRANSAEGDYSLAMGEINTASGNHSTAMGWNTNALGDFSSTNGQYTNADAFNNFVIGRYNKGGGSTNTWNPTDPLFEIGNGSGFQGNESNALTVLKNGKTGIGTHTPDEALSVVGSIRGSLEEAESNFVEMGHGGNNAFINADGIGNLDIRHGDQNIMTLTSGKYVGIKTNNPQADFHLVHVNNSASGGLRLENTSTGDYAKFYVASSDGHLRIYTDDQTGAIGFFNDASGAYSATSDRRLKEEFEDLRFDWTSFMKLQALIYEYKVDEDNQKHIGMVAQDVMEIYPEVVTYDSEEGIYHMNYDAFGVIAIKAIQKQHELLEVKSDRIDDLEERLVKMESSMNYLLEAADMQSVSNQRDEKK